MLKKLAGSSDGTLRYRYAEQVHLSSVQNLQGGIAQQMSAAQHHVANAKSLIDLLVLTASTSILC